MLDPLTKPSIWPFFWTKFENCAIAGRLKLVISNSESDIWNLGPVFSNSKTVTETRGRLFETQGQLFEFPEFEWPPIIIFSIYAREKHIKFPGVLEMKDQSSQDENFSFPTL